MAPAEALIGLAAAVQNGFYHPYEPYDIQLRFMKALYECIEEGKVGIFESPTGDDEPEWMLEYAREEKRQAALRQRADLEDRLVKVRAQEKRLKERRPTGPTCSKQKKARIAGPDIQVGDEESFLLDDYESCDDASDNSRSRPDPDLGYSAQTQALMRKLGMAVGKDDQSNDDIVLLDESKIFYCSRTHSQLTQFSGELRRVKMPPAISLGSKAPRDDSDTAAVEGFKYLTLGSRKSLCINSKVQKLGSTTLINERCLDLQKPGTSAEHKCPYLPTKETKSTVNDFRDHVLADIRDIEDLGAIGTRLGICPYYASRSAVRPSEIVTLPYPLLFQKTARETLGISVKGHVVIVDEAHNLMDAITDIHSVAVSHSHLQRSRDQLMTYLRKFRNRLKDKNRVYVAQTVRLLDSLIGYLVGTASQAETGEGVVQVSDLMAGKGVDQINLYKLMRYLDESKLARKIDGYAVHVDEQARAKDQPRERATATPVLMHVQNFIYALVNPSAEGRFFYAKDDQNLGLCLRYMLLDPTHHFREIVEDARAVILAGGTMSPMDDYIDHLLSYHPLSRIMKVSCDHVIPPSNLLVWPVTTGPSGAPFDFRFKTRESQGIVIDLGRALLSLIASIPDGVVIFFPSYAYLDRCIKAWQNAGPPRPPCGPQDAISLYDALATVKPIFHEAKRRASSAPSPDTVPTSAPEASDAVLSDYSNAVATGNGRGALLLAVVGGSLSEGINFSDGLGRGVAVVGLPFPNPHSAEWIARRSYVAKKAIAKGDGKAVDNNGEAAATEFYVNACMRAVNQCVGRAIRHRNDYASILLIDQRFESEHMKKKLPSWIRSSLRGGADVDTVRRALEEFFQAKRG